MSTLTQAPPERSLAQRQAALRQATEIRSRRAQLKRDMKAGIVRDASPLVASPPEYLETMKIFDLLLALPKYGRVKVSKTLTRCQISPSKTLGGLSPRQRQLVIQALGRGTRR